MQQMPVIYAPSSKSQSIRAILFASLADGTSKITNVLWSRDIKSMIDACKQLGAKFEYNGKSLIITGCANHLRLPDDVIDAGNSGLVLRLIGAIASLIEGYTIITGDQSIRYRRPITDLIFAIEQLGANAYASKQDGYAPLIVKGVIKPGKVIMDGADSQPVSAMLIALSMLAGKSEIHVENPGELPWIELTLSWLARFGAKIINNSFKSYIIHGPCRFQAFTYNVPGDFSSIAFPVAAAILQKVPLKIKGLDFHDPQGDKILFDYLRSAGASIEYADNDSLIIQPSSNLRGMELDVNQCIDALPILDVLACFASSNSRFYNAGIARFKESNRLAAITDELKKMQANIIATDDSITVIPAKLQPALVKSHNDHRIAMALYVAAKACGYNPKIDNIDCIQKTYPNFLEHMQVISQSKALL